MRGATLRCAEYLSTTTTASARGPTRRARLRSIYNSIQVRLYYYNRIQILVDNNFFIQTHNIFTVSSDLDSVFILVRQFNREGRRALRVGPLAEAVVVVESLMGTGGGA